MKKLFILLVFCLTLILSLLLKWQWHAYSTSSSESMLKEADQKIQLVSSSTQLDIKQFFSGLSSKKEYEIIVPDLVSDWSCETKSGEPCKSNDQNPYTFLPEDGVLKINYSVPIKRDKPFILLSNWKMKINEVIIQHSTVTMAESFNRKGIWIAGLPFKGYKELELIDFFSFEGEGDFESLYFQKEILDFHHQESFYGYYSSDQNSKQLILPQFNQLPNKKFMAVVSSNYLNYESKDMVIVKKTQSATNIDNLLVRQFFKEKLENDKDWLLNVFISYSSQESSLDNKTNQIWKELNRELSSVEIKEFYQKVTSSSSTLSVKELDAILSEVKRLKTSFFQNNVGSNSLSPLYFVETKLVSLKEEKPTSVDIIYMNSKRLYPIETMTRIIGYNVSRTDGKLNLNKKSYSYQFDLHHNLFHFNGHDYGLLENPIDMVNDTYYMDQNLLQTLFKISIKDVGENLLINEERK